VQTANIAAGSAIAWLDDFSIPSFTKLSVTVPAGSKEPAYWAFPGASISTNAPLFNDKPMSAVNIYVLDLSFIVSSNKPCRPTADTGVQPTAAGMTGNIHAYNRHMQHDM
jgi:hypothetical protein